MAKITETFTHKLTETEAKARIESALAHYKAAHSWLVMSSTWINPSQCQISLDLSKDIRIMGLISLSHYRMTFEVVYDTKKISFIPGAVATVQKYATEAKREIAKWLDV